jgi:uncharacterized membrane protein YeaQ/YmgE (transglycosylase-associated protein family)
MEVAPTIASWLILGVALGLLAPIAMPVPVSRGRTLAVIVGIISSLIGGGLGAYFANAPLVGFSALSAGAAAISALYVLFAYQCLEMRR